jgi:hypothetical protein
LASISDAGETDDAASSCSLSKMNNDNGKNAKDFQFGILIPSKPTEQPKEEEREVKDPKGHD